MREEGRMTRPKDDLARTVISILALCGLILTVFWIVRPFLTAVIWATLIAVATWPILLKVQKVLWRKRGLAVAVMTLALFLVALLPFLAAVVTLVSHGEAIGNFATTLPGYKIPPPPAFLEKVPGVGSQAHEVWQQVAVEGTPGLIKKVTPYLGMVAKWFAAQVGNFGLLLAQFFLTLIITAVLYASGEGVVHRVRAFFHRLLGQRGDDLLPLIGGAIRGVAMGVVVTALGQAVLGGVGLVIAGVPFAAPLTAAMIILCIAQVGPGLVLIPAVIWTYSVLGPGWGTFLLVWSIVAMFIDNLIRPVLIKAGAPIPILVVFAGVLGGLMSLGLIGIFVGPVVLAVAQTLFKAWLEWEGSPAELAEGS
jgi:predicted PurR-regulated permease PerM